MAGFFDHRVTAIDGAPDLLGPLGGQVVLAVNVASRCGFTPQYAGLEQLQQDLASERFTVVGFPCNQFGAQEPGTEAQIKNFCERTYQVTFPMTAKVNTIGGDAHPFYKWVVAELGEDAAPRWNFHKYLIAPGGKAVYSFRSAVEPDGREILSRLTPMLKPAPP